MGRHLPSKATVLGLVLLPLLLGGCASKSSRFYTLNPAIPAPSPGPVQSTPPAGPPAASIGIVLVEIPDYLDRPQIVTRNENNELKLAEFDRWAGELDNDVARVLAEKLSASLPDNEVLVLTGRRAVPADYRIAVHLTRFDAMPGNVVWLNALWTVLGKEGRHIAIRSESNFAEPIQGTGYEATVAAMSRAIDKLGAEIAGAVKSMLAESAKARQAEARQQQAAVEGAR